MPAADALVPIAFISAAHGLHGEVHAKLLNPDSDLLATRSDVLLRRGPEDSGQRVAILSARVHRHGLMLVVLAGCGDRNAAEALRGVELCVPRAELPKLDAGEHYLVDLIGLDAKTRDGTVVGRVHDAREYPAAQTLRVQLDAGYVEVPLLPHYVVEIRLDERAVIVDHLEDLELEPATRERTR